MAILTNCCCRWTPKQGTIFISVFIMLGSVIALIACTVFSVRIEQLAQQRDYHDPSLDQVKNVKPMLIIGIVASLITLTCSALLFHGVRTHNHKHLLPWILWFGLNVAASVAIFIIILIRTNGRPVWITALYIVMYVIVFVIAIYLILCVISQYQIIVLERSRAQQFGAQQVS